MLKRNICKIAIFFVAMWLAPKGIYAQQVTINVDNKSLNEVFFYLRDQYGVQFSFNDKLLAECIIKVSKTYDNLEQAISILVKNCDLKYKLNNGVYIIYQKKTSDRVKSTKKSIYIYKGSIVDSDNLETLPFSNILVGKTGFISDGNGNFAFKSKDSSIHIQISHLGYYVIDTMLLSDNNHNIELKSLVIGLKEAEIVSTKRLYKIHIGEQPGLMKMNSKMAAAIPGNNNNMAINLLRLQPGIMAAGEQSGDYIIRGSYKGQNLILFDGITIFNISSYNENVGSINPLIIKDIEVIKGGYNVNIGDRSGGVVNITGLSGNPDKFGGKISINNQAASGLINIPLSSKSVLLTSFRHTYLYNNKVSEFFNYSNDKSDEYKYNYLFKDINLKYAGKGENGDHYYISMIGSQDLISNKYFEEEGTRTYLNEQGNDRYQLGGALFYCKNWKNAGATDVKFSYSKHGSRFNNKIEFDDKVNVFDDYAFTGYTENSISVLSLKAEHKFPVFNVNNFNIGVGYNTNTTGFRQDTADVTRKDTDDGLHRIHFFIKDKISISEWFSIQPGVRIDQPFNTLEPFIQPRINASILPFKRFKINLATGIYNQFINETAIVDGLNNYLYHWMISDNKYIPVLKSKHYLTGISYDFNGFNFSVEGFYKTTDGLSRFITDYTNENLHLINGSGKCYGIDFFLSKEVKKHDLWIAYTLSKTEELFIHTVDFESELAPHDQRHELKVVGMFNFNPVFCSVNYVYGSGLVNSDPNNITPYNRLDVAFLYRFKSKRYKIETGLSILNVLNSKNVRFNNFSNFPTGETVYYNALPFTPSLFLNFGF